jgi:hypothetical protein
MKIIPSEFNVRVYHVIRRVFTALLMFNVVWVAYLFLRSLFTGRFMGGDGWAYGYGLFFLTLPVLLLFLVYELESVRRFKEGLDAGYTRRNRHLALLVLVANVSFTIHQRLLFGV